MKDTRDLTGNPEAMHALAHPVRLALLDLLGRDGALTATQAAELLGQLPGNVSWHLRVLARHGFVAETGERRGRRRPWALTAAGQRFDTEPVSEEERLAADALLRTVVERSFGQLRAWLGSRYLADEQWRRAAALSDWTLYLTPEEAERLRKQIYDLLEAFGDRRTDPTLRPPGARPVKAFVAVHPQQLTRLP